MSYVHAVCRHDERYSSCTDSITSMLSMAQQPALKYWLCYWHYTTWGAAQGVVYNRKGAWQSRGKIITRVKLQQLLHALYKKYSRYQVMLINTNRSMYH